MKNNTQSLEETIGDLSIVAEIKNSKILNIDEEYATNLSISDIECSNFQGFERLKSNVNKGVNVFIGDNFEGKSSLINFIAHTIGAEVGNVLSNGKELGFIKIGFYNDKSKGRVKIDLAEKRTFKVEGDSLLRNSFRLDSLDYKIFVWRHKLKYEQTNFAFTQKKEEFLMELELFKWSPYIHFLDGKLDIVSKKARELELDINTIQGEISSTKLLEEEICEIGKDISNLTNEKNKLVTEMQSILYAVEDRDLNTLDNQVKKNEIRLIDLNKQKSQINSQLIQYQRLSNLSLNSRILNTKLHQSNIHCPICKEKVQQTKKDVCPLCGMKNDYEIFDDIELIAHSEFAQENTKDLINTLHKLDTKISNLQSENESIFNLINDPSNRRQTELHKHLQNTIINIANLENQENELKQKNSNIQGNHSLLKTKLEEMKSIQDKINRYTNVKNKLSMSISIKSC